MPDQPSFPSLSDDELRETLELLSTVMASVSDRVDDQTKALDRINKTATEARQAAFAAKAQTDPERYGALVGQTIDGHLSETLQRLEYATNHLDRGTKQTAEVLGQARQDQRDTLRSISNREERLRDWQARWPWFALGTVVLALAMSVALPRFMASHPSTCAIIGGVWTSTTTGTDACVFYRP